VAEIADYMEQNPSLKVGIDGSSPRGSDPGALDLAGLRIIAVRNALIKAGVPAFRIEMGTFGDPQLVREGRVEVLLRSR
ncbi:MAG: OmpA family protein, partial [Thermodesulfobacteriota bacterium]